MSLSSLGLIIMLVSLVVSEFLHYLSDIQEAKNAEVNERLRQQGN